MGVLGVCALRALRAQGVEVRGRAQDRDELARVFTAYNARRNGIDPAWLEVRAEPLLSGRPPGGWDLILANVPAKAGRPVLEDFFRRVPASLSREGRAFLVVVAPLAAFARSALAEGGAELLPGEQGGGHEVFVCGPGVPGSGAVPEGGAGSAAAGGGEWTMPAAGAGEESAPGAASAPEPAQDFFAKNPAYLRGSGEYRLEGVSYRVDAAHGAPGFDSPGGAVAAAAKLALRLGAALRAPLGAAAPRPLPALFYEDPQGHFVSWFARFTAGEGRLAPRLAGRNVIALEAARHNAAAALGYDGAALYPVADLALDAGRLDAPPEGYPLLFLFPPGGALAAPASLWDALERLAAPGSLALAALPSSEAERLDRKKAPGFTRRGDLRRDGFRALAYLRGA